MNFTPLPANTGLVIEAGLTGAGLGVGDGLGLGLGPGLGAGPGLGPGPGLGLGLSFIFGLSAIGAQPGIRLRAAGSLGHFKVRECGLNSEGPGTLDSLDSL